MAVLAAAPVNASSTTQRVLTTGGSDFLGINLIRHLLPLGYRIVSYDLAPFNYPEAAQLDAIQGDIRAQEAGVEEDLGVHDRGLQIAAQDRDHVACGPCLELSDRGFGIEGRVRRAITLATPTSGWSDDGGSWLRNVQCGSCYPAFAECAGGRACSSMSTSRDMLTGYACRRGGVRLLPRERDTSRGEADRLRSN